MELIWVNVPLFCLAQYPIGRRSEGQPPLDQTDGTRLSPPWM